MLIIKVQDGEIIDRYLKMFKYKTQRTGVIKKLKEKQEFTKKSVKSRKQKQKAIYKNQLKQKADES